MRLAIRTGIISVVQSGIWHEYWWCRVDNCMKWSKMQLKAQHCQYECWLHSAPCYQLPISWSSRMVLWLSASFHTQLQHWIQIQSSLREVVVASPRECLHLLKECLWVLVFEFQRACTLSLGIMPLQVMDRVCNAMEWKWWTTPCQEHHKAITHVIQWISVLYHDRPVLQSCYVTCVLLP